MAAQYLEGTDKRAAQLMWHLFNYEAPAVCEAVERAFSAQNQSKHGYEQCGTDFRACRREDVTKRFPQPHIDHHACSPSLAVGKPAGSAITGETGWTPECRLLWRAFGHRGRPIWEWFLERAALKWNLRLHEVKEPVVSTDGGASWTPDFGSRFFTDDVAHGLCVLLGMAEIVAVLCS